MYSAFRLLLIAFSLPPFGNIALQIAPGLLEIAASGVTSRVVGQKSEDKQRHKEANNDINNDFQS